MPPVEQLDLFEMENPEVAPTVDNPNPERELSYAERSLIFAHHNAGKSYEEIADTMFLSRGRIMGVVEGFSQSASVNNLKMSDRTKPKMNDPVKRALYGTLVKRSSASDEEVLKALILLGMDRCSRSGHKHDPNEPMFNLVIQRKNNEPVVEGETEYYDNSLDNLVPVIKMHHDGANQCRVRKIPAWFYEDQFKNTDWKALQRAYDLMGWSFRRLTQLYHIKESVLILACYRGEFDPRSTKTKKSWLRKGADIENRILREQSGEVEKICETVV